MSNNESSNNNDNKNITRDQEKNLRIFRNAGPNSNMDPSTGSEPVIDMDALAKEAGNNENNNNNNNLDIKIDQNTGLQEQPRKVPRIFEERGPIAGTMIMELAGYLSAFPAEKTSPNHAQFRDLISAAVPTDADNQIYTDLNTTRIWLPILCAPVFSVAAYRLLGKQFLFPRLRSRFVRIPIGLGIFFTTLHQMTNDELFRRKMSTYISRGESAQSAGYRLWILSRKDLIDDIPYNVRRNLVDNIDRDVSTIQHHMPECKIDGLALIARDSIALATQNAITHQDIRSEKKQPKSLKTSMFVTVMKMSFTVYEDHQNPFLQNDDLDNSSWDR